MAAAAGERVVAPAAGERVVAPAAGQRVVAPAAGKSVVAPAAGECVVTAAAGQRVVARPAPQVVVAAAAPDVVGPPRAGDAVVAGAAEEGDAEVLGLGQDNRIVAAQRAGGVREVREVELVQVAHVRLLREKDRGEAEHHIALAGVAVGTRRPDDQVIEAVAVDVARARDRAAAVVTGVDPVEPEAVRAVERGQIEARGEARGRAEDDVALAGDLLPSGIGARRPDDQVVDAVAVEVARARDREAAVVIGVDPVEPEAVAAVERGQIEARGEARGGAEHHVALAGVVTARVARAPR